MKKIPIADSMLSLTDLLEDSRAGFEVVPTGLSSMPTWHFNEGALSHVSGGFFSVVGVRFEATDQAPRRDALFLFQPQSAINGLLTCVVDGIQHFLLQARAEPGNVGQAQFGPTLQSTPANYLCVHGGKATPFIEWFSTHRPDVQVLHDSVQLDLGERYLFKSKRVIVAKCSADIAVPEGFVWVPAWLVNAAASRSTFLNTDLRALFGLCAWGAGAGDLVPLSHWVTQSSRLPLRADAVAGVVLALQGGGSARYALQSVASMTGWRAADDGIFDEAGGQGFDVGYFHVEARRREVARWQQPLIKSRSEGCARLLCRVVDGVFEVCVRVGAEWGLQTGRALQPSYLRYPGAAGADPQMGVRVLLQTRESDEGGRFFQDASVYEIIQVASGAQVEGCWLRISELKWFLSCSNFCAIQLRVLGSLLLGELGDLDV